MNPFYGNETATRMLASLTEGGHLGHAYLFYGADGLGKKTLATQFAMRILCGGEVKPCLSCPACIKMQHGTHPDFKIIDEVTKSGAMTVDTVRSLRFDCAVKPNEADYKIYLLPNIERMTEGAFNAFLKTLEEPPRHVVFLLTAAGTELLAPTILSRVTPVPLYPLDEQTVFEALAADFSKTEERLRRQAALLSEGNLGVARAILSDAGFADREAKVQAFCDTVALRQEYALLRWLVQFDRDKAALQEVLERVLWAVRGALLCRVDSSRTPKAEEEKLTQRWSSTQLMDLLAYLEEMRQRLAGNGNYNLTLFALAAGIGRRMNG